MPLSLLEALRVLETPNELERLDKLGLLEKLKVNWGTRGARVAIFYLNHQRARHTNHAKYTRATKGPVLVLVVLLELGTLVT